MSKAKFKKLLSQIDEKTKTELLMELYEKRPDTREYLEFWMDPDPEKEFENAREKIRKVYYRNPETPRPNPNPSAASAIVKNFASLCCGMDKDCQLEAYSLETRLEWMLYKKKRKWGETVLRNQFDRLEKAVVAAGMDDEMAEILDKLRKQIEFIYSEDMIERNRGYKRYLRFNF